MTLMIADPPTSGTRLGVGFDAEARVDEPAVHLSGERRAGEAGADGLGHFLGHQAKKDEPIGHRHGIGEMKVELELPFAAFLVE